MTQMEWTPEKLEACYANIRAQTKSQRENYARFINQAGTEQVNKWKQLADELQLELDVDSGRIRYKEGFQPLDIKVDICYVRHGKTQGNTEPRVYQGMVDYPENQLNEIGKQQATVAAEKLEEMLMEGKWAVPDLIVSSPLQRAQQTAAPFRERHKEVPYSVLLEAGEMRFGSWDNVKVADLPATNICHLFYIEQNALVKSNEPHKINEDSWVNPEWLNGETEVSSENFLECMLRQREALRVVESKAQDILKRNHPGEERRPRVVMYGHSMAGAAISVLLGFGRGDASGWLGFDGSYIMPNATPTLLIPEQKQKEQ